jgi:hypothetical protein
MVAATRDVGDRFKEFPELRPLTTYDNFRELSGTDE